MDAYSVTLALALVTGGVGLLAVFSGRAREPGQMSHRVGRASGVFGLAFALAAFAIHFLSGHRPGSEQALGPIQFAGEHPALVAAGILAAVAIWSTRAR
ncbi:MAG: hypothetical protein HKM89_07055 [Gemmatimonadales bacterium]|nr:hypothetical protein [Gemmatimonadales bacterium]